MTKVKLRRKAISGYRHSLYLDFYPPIPHPVTGKPTRREFLGLYLFDKVKSPIDKQHNHNIQMIAEQIRQKRDNQINKPEIYTAFEREQLKIKELQELNFVEYFKKLSDKRKASNHDNWVAAYNYLHNYTGGNLKFADLNEKFCNDFREHLLTTGSKKSNKTTLSQNSVVSYYNKMKAALKQAFKDGYLQADLNSRIKPVKQVETHREYLTMEELQRLAKTDCAIPVLKQAAIFSALTGLRFSDIEKLVWGEFHHSQEEGHYIQFRQKKTKGFEVLPISEQAYNLAGERKEPNEKIFRGLKYSAHNNFHLKHWVDKAGITKNITFHCFRHTYATLQLTFGTDIYTVSKMLGHRELKTTQVYAKIVDRAKREAADRIKLDL